MGSDLTSLSLTPRMLGDGGDPIRVERVVAEHGHHLDVDEPAVPPDVAAVDPFADEARLLVRAPAAVVAGIDVEAHLLHRRVAEGGFHGHQAGPGPAARATHTKAHSAGGTQAAGPWPWPQRAGGPIKLPQPQWRLRWSMQWKPVV